MPDAVSPAVKAFCVGQAKAGTASLVGLLAAHHRAAHEPERAETLALILREARGELSRSAVRAVLGARDRRLDLEYDVAWANQFLVGHLVDVFPGARFVVLLRDPYTWLASIVGHLLSRNIPPDVRAFLDWWFEPERHPHSRHDRALEERGLYSVAAFLAAWSRHVSACAERIPPGRRLVLRTHELDRSHARLAAFLDIPLDSLDRRRGHLNRSTAAVPLDTLVAREHVADVVHATCGAGLARHFPEVAGWDDVERIWRDDASADARP